jgi:hypothetical protein
MTFPVDGAKPQFRRRRKKTAETTLICNQSLELPAKPTFDFSGKFASQSKFLFEPFTYM